MGAGQRAKLPADLVRAQSRFRDWRRRRQTGSRIPQPLWTLAVRLAKIHGLSRTAAALGLDYYRLRKRAGAIADISHSDSADRQSGSGGTASGSAAFVELLPPAGCPRQCLLELDNGAGTTLRVQLTGYDAAEIGALARHLWNAG